MSRNFWSRTCHAYASATVSREIRETCNSWLRDNVHKKIETVPSAVLEEVYGDNEELNSSEKSGVRVCMTICP
jgi:hypothetical protein